MSAPDAREAWLRVVFSEAGPRATVRLVLGTVGRHMDWERPRTFVGIRRIARDAGLSTETVTDALREAESDGWIERSAFTRGARREIRAALPLCGDSGQSRPDAVCGDSGQSTRASVRVVSGSSGESVRIHPGKCAVDPDKPSSTSSDLLPACARETVDRDGDRLRSAVAQKFAAGLRHVDEIVRACEMWLP